MIPASPTRIRVLLGHPDLITRDTSSTSAGLGPFLECAQGFEPLRETHPAAFAETPGLGNQPMEVTIAKTPGSVTSPRRGEPSGLHAPPERSAKG